MYINIISVDDALSIKEKISSISNLDDTLQIFLHFTIAHVEITKKDNTNYLAKINRIFQLNSYILDDSNLLLLIDKAVKYIFTNIFNKKQFNKSERRALSTKFNFNF